MMLRQATDDLNDEGGVYEWQSVQYTVPLSPHQDPGEADFGPCLCELRCPCHPHRASFATHHILLCVCLAAVWPRGQPLED